MKINKVILGLGVVSLALTSCDPAAEQDYQAAPAVATPPAYFSLDYDSDITLEEEQTSFDITLYRADGAAAQTTPVELTLSTSASADGLFTVPTASGDKAINPGETVTAQAQFAEGSTETTLTVSYPWDRMKDLSGLEFNFKLSVDGEDTPYFVTTSNYTAMYVPWLNPTNEETGETTCYFVDDAVYSGWRLTGYGTPWKYEVEMQYNPIALERKGQLIYRVITPYANLGHMGQDAGYFYFDGYDENGDVIKNIMYINATDPYDVYLCQSNGDPLTDIYDTYYVISDDYGHVGYLDRSACYAADDSYCVFNGSGYSNSGGSAAVNGYIDDSGLKLMFPENHFYVCMLGDGSAITYSNQLQVWLPGAKEEVEWEDLGMASLTDNVVGYFDDYGEQTYDVPAQQNIKDSNLYRIVNPFTNYWPDGGYETDDDFNIEFDVTNPNCVVIALADTGRELPVAPGKKKTYANYFSNAANLLMNYMNEGYEMSESEIISAGYNDTFANNVIDIKNPVLWFVDDDDKNVDIVTSSDAASAMDITYVEDMALKVVLPSASGAPRYATKAAANKAGKKSSTQRARKMPLPTLAKVVIR